MTSQASAVIADLAAARPQRTGLDGPQRAAGGEEARAGAPSIEHAAVRALSLSPALEAVTQAASRAAAPSVDRADVAAPVVSAPIESPREPRKAGRKGGRFKNLKGLLEKIMKKLGGDGAEESGATRRQRGRRMARLDAHRLLAAPTSDPASGGPVEPREVTAARDGVARVIAQRAYGAEQAEAGAHPMLLGG